MATVAVLSSSPLLAMHIEENIDINNPKSGVHQLPITLSSEVANELYKNKSILTSAGEFEVNLDDSGIVNKFCKNKNAFFVVPSSLFNEGKNLLLQRIYSQEEEFTVKSIILNKLEKLDIINTNVPILNFEELEIQENKKSLEIIEEVRKPIPIPQCLDTPTLKQILEDGYFNTTEGMFKFSRNNNDLAQSIYIQLTQENSGYIYLMPVFSTRDANGLTFHFVETGTELKNPNWHPEFIENPNWVDGQEKFIKNPLWNPYEPEWLPMPGMTYSFTLEKE